MVTMRTAKKVTMMIEIVVRKKETIYWKYWMQAQRRRTKTKQIVWWAECTACFRAVEAKSPACLHLPPQVHFWFGWDEGSGSQSLEEDERSDGMLDRFSELGDKDHDS